MTRAQSQSCYDTSFGRFGHQERSERRQASGEANGKDGRAGSERRAWRAEMEKSILFFGIPGNFGEYSSVLCDVREGLAFLEHLHRVLEFCCPSLPFRLYHTSPPNCSCWEETSVLTEAY